MLDFSGFLQAGEMFKPSPFEHGTSPSGKPLTQKTKTGKTIQTTEEVKEGFDKASNVIDTSNNQNETSTKSSGSMESDYTIEPDTIFQVQFKTEAGSEFYGNILGGKKADSIINANPKAKDAEKRVQSIID